MKREGRPSWRRIDGIVLLDKPAGLSSNQALQKLRRLLSAEKAGHTGALDPLATGMLPICLGEATKIAGLLLAGDKAYRARVQLGIDTDTDDAEGEIVRERPVPPLSRADVETALLGFVGRIQQVPPRYSALKRDGEPLYRRARRGETFSVPAREVEVSRIDLIDMGADWLEVEVECGSGTYIRSLARDLGDLLQCGGHITELRRLWVEPFHQHRMLTLEQFATSADQLETLLSEALLPIESGLTRWRRLPLSAEQETRLRQGQRFEVGVESGPVLAMGVDGGVIGLADVDAEGVLVARRLFVPPPAEAETDMLMSAVD